MVGRFDLDGNELWYRKLLPGQLYNVIDDSDGNILAVGETYSNVWPDDMRALDEPVIRWNSDPTFDYTTVDCAVFGTNNVPRMGYVVKLDPAGNILWCTLLSAELGPQGFLKRSNLLDIAEVPNGTEMAYRIVGFGTTSADPTALATIYQVDGDGTLTDLTRFANGGSGVPSSWPACEESFFYSIAFDAAENKFFATGRVKVSGINSQAVGLLVDASDPDQTPLWHLTTIDPSGTLAAQGGHDPTKVNYTSGGGFVEQAGNTRIVWPILANYAYGDYYSGPKEANLYVHGFDLLGNLNWTTDLGKVNAYDLQSDMTATADGMVAVVSTVRDNGLIDDGEFTWDELPTSTQACILSDFDYVPQGNTTEDVTWPTTDRLRYWNTNAMVAKLDPSTGDMLWCTAWDADPETNFQCSPDDIRNQECMYKITEMQDGGLVVSGNTSHNFDDYYLTKLHSDCQSKQAFTDLDINSEGVSILAGGMWSTDQNVYGTLIVPTGTTLTIQDCTIRFADSEQLAIPTRLIVEPGGALNVVNATLTAIDQCPNSMWDGIVLQGDAEASQSAGVNGMEQATFKINAGTVQNARTAVVVANTFRVGSLSNIPNNERSGGILNARDAAFRNNLFDVSFSPYENFVFDSQTQEPVVANNRSSFIRTKFVTEGRLAKAGLTPRNHATLALVRGITFSGCTFMNDLGAWRDYEFYADQGVGIRSISSSFRVQAHCNVPLAYGESCPSGSQIISRFEGLYRGVGASTMDLSRTFSVSKAEFDRVRLGVRMDGIHDAAITECSFAIPDARPDDEISTMYGIYSEQCTGYKIEENSFTNTNADIQRRKAGLVIRNSGPDHNKFYNNTFDGLRLGSVIMGINAGEKSAEGLEVKCNDYGMTSKNAFDVALTGFDVTVQSTQGGPVIATDPLTRDDPAGNRFSAHTNADDPESDWHVSSSNFVTYFHHSPDPGNRTNPLYYDAAALTPNQSVAGWPEKSVACPSNFGRRKAQLREASGLAQEGLEDASAAYDATKDNGDTYTLLGYVNDPTHNSTQVRNALQSVAPKVSADVWKAAFERYTPMQAWHITQALLSNSPLQGEVLKMVEVYGLPTYYADLVYSGQSGDASLLTKLQSEVARFAAAKADALTDLGHQSWLDSLDLGGSLDSLKLWHLYLPGDNSPSTIAGVLSAKRELAALQLLAQAEENNSATPEVYSVVKRYAAAEQQGGWNGSSADHTYIGSLAGQREKIGSALAYSWREAMGEELPEEIIIYPGETPKLHFTMHQPTVEWPTDVQLEAFPNPTDGLVFITYELPENAGITELRIVDLSGRELLNERLLEGPGVRTVQTDQWSSGLYIAELRINGAGLATTKLTVR